MPRGLRNWNFFAVQRFLRKHGFILHHIEGSHHFYKSVRNGKEYQACVHFHGSRPIKPKTMKSIILQSGIPLEEWLEN